MFLRIALRPESRLPPPSCPAAIYLPSTHRGYHAGYHLTERLSYWSPCTLSHLDKLHWFVQIFGFAYICQMYWALFQCTVRHRSYGIEAEFSLSKDQNAYQSSIDGGRRMIYALLSVAPICLLGLTVFVRWDSCRLVHRVLITWLDISSAKITSYRPYCRSPENVPVCEFSFLPFLSYAPHCSRSQFNIQPFAIAPNTRRTLNHA